MRLTRTKVTVIILLLIAAGIPIWLIYGASVTESGIDFPAYSLSGVDVTDILEYPEQPASYIIFKDGSTYYAKNASTGQIDSSNSNYVTLMVGIIQDDVEIYLKEGIYTSTGSIPIQSSNIIIRGSGNSTLIIHQYSGQSTFRIYSTDNSNPVDNIAIRDIGFIGYNDNENHMIGTTNCTNFVVEGCYFKNVGDEPISIGKNSHFGTIRNNWLMASPYNGTESFAAAICMQGSSYIIIENNYINMTGGADAIGIGLEAILTVGDISNIDIVGNTIINPLIGIMLTTTTCDIYELKIIGNTVINATRAGITDSTSGAEQSYKVIVDSNIVRDGGTHADARGAINFAKNNPEYITITNNQVYNWDITSGNKHGIYIGATNSIISNNLINGTGDAGIRVGGNNVVIIGNTIKDHGLGGGIKAGIQVYDDYNTIIGNTIKNGYRGIRTESTADYTMILGNTLEGNNLPIDNQGTNNKISQNIGFNTENSGTQTCADNENIVHGLAGTPTFASIIPMNDTYDGVPVIATVDWSGVDATNIRVGLYWVNGTAISTDIILVSWSAKYDP